MIITQRQAVIGLFLLQTIGALALALTSIASRDPGAFLLFSAFALYVTLLFAYWRGFEWARHLNVIALIVTTGFGTSEPFLSEQVSLSVLTVPVLVLLLTNVYWLVGGTTVLISILALRVDGSPYVAPGNLAIIVTAIGALAIMYKIKDSAQRRAEQLTEIANASAADAASKAEALLDANQQLEQQMAIQLRLLELVSTLETPAVSLATGVLLSPLVGHIDSRRAEQLQQKLLHIVHKQHTRLLVLDISGIPVLDSAVAAALVSTVHSIRLLGCRVVISGISSSTAPSLVELGIDFSSISTVRSPQDALALTNGAAHF